jgi:hypothetical protein
MKDKFDKPFSEGGDPLDELLQTASWPEPNPESVSRLRQRFQQSLLRRKRARLRHWAAVVAALAAGLMISATLWTLRNRMSENGPPVANKQGNEKRHPADPMQPKLVNTPSDHSLPKKNVRGGPAEERKIAAAESMTRQPTPYEALLFKTAVDKRRAEVKSYRKQTDGQIASQTPPPKQNPPDHASAVRALLPRIDAGGLARLASREENLDLQKEIFAVMLERGDPRAVGVYLDFVSNREYSERALDALGGLNNPPSELLFDFLRGTHASRRLAAALTLGRIDGPETSRKLFQMVRGEVGRQEAMVALMASSGQEASLYVNLVRRDTSLAGVFNGARYQYRLLSSIQ